MTILRLREKNLRWLESGEEVVAFDEAGAAYFGANTAGTVLWRLLSEGCTREDLMLALVDTFGVDSERAEADVDSYLRQLDENELLERE